jgi:hypothetical protein
MDFMASVQSDTKKRLDISSLMSPPEPPRLGSFSSQNDMPVSLGLKVSDVRHVSGPVPPISPPISPATKLDHHVQGAAVPMANAPVRDPILYTPRDPTVSPSQQPLFVREESVDTQRIVDEHVAARPATLFKNASPPRRADYELTLCFQSRVMELYLKSPKKWLRRERAQLEADRKARAGQGQFKLPRILPAKPQPIRSHVQRVSKPTKDKVIRHPPAERVIRQNPPSTVRQPAVRKVSMTPDPPSRRVVAPNREDKDFESLPDLCPPKDSLPNRSNSLKVDWKGAPIDLSNDPHRHLLHADEVTLAANLRLDCATYLTSKRRMFVRRLECLRVGKEFRKTDAQQACKIDVNKASKLWTAFEKVGWLDKHWIARFL